MHLEKIKKIVKLILFVSIPFICIAISDLGNGKTIGDFYLPRMYGGNDELIYVKQVAGTLKYGLPLGYFGYNESHAILGPYSCWSPILLIGWVVFGFIFGWNSITLVLINILLLTIAFVSMYFLIRPDRKTMLKIGIIYGSATWITRCAYLALPEVTCYSLSIILICLVVRSMKKYSKCNIVFQFIIIFGLTIMRPFYIALIAFPIWIMWKNKSRGRLPISIFCTGFFIGSYFFVHHFLCAALRFDNQEGSLVNANKLSFNDGILRLIYKILQIIVFSFKEMLVYLQEFLEGTGAKGLFLFLVLFAFFVYKAYQCYKEREWDNLFLFLICSISYFLMLIAVFLLFDIRPGDKHLLEFVVWGLFVLLLSGKLNKKEFIILEVALVISYVFYPTQRSNPPKAEIAACREEFKIYEEELQDVMLLETENKIPSYHNTIDWIIDDTENWSVLFAVPDGFGINICYSIWFLDDNTEIQSRYVATSPNQRCARKCEALGGWPIAEYDGIVIYQLY